MGFTCLDCKKNFASPQIHFGTVYGRKVDIIDWFCPECGAGDINFVGSLEEENQFWMNALLED